MELLIKNGKVVFTSGVVEADVLISDGVISAIAKSIERGCEKINASGKLILPGAIDTHVHLREPGFEYKEDFKSGTIDAACGGVTTVFDMPNNNPPVDAVDRLLEKKRVVEGKSWVDWGLYGVIRDNNLNEIDGMVREGVVGFKVYMVPTLGGIKPPSVRTIYEALLKSKHLGLVIAFHAEDGDLVNYFTEKTRSIGDSPELYVESRPPLCEEVALLKITSIARETKGIVHVSHVSSCEALNIVIKAKQNGLDVTCETNPHYLILDKKDYSRLASVMKIAPPVRGGIHRDCLWKGVVSGWVDTLASDHSPHALFEKKTDIWSAPTGFPGVRTLLPLMLDQAFRGNIPLEYLPKLLSENPAKRFKIPRKGVILPGYDADLVIVDPNKEWAVKSSDFFSKSKYTPYEGMVLKGLITHTILRGEIVCENGVPIDKPLGKFIRPHLSQRSTPY